MTRMKNKMEKIYSCKRCLFQTDRKFNWITHLASNKHRGICKPPRQYTCHSCKYTTLNNSNFHKHCRTKRHIENHCEPVGVVT